MQDLVLGLASAQPGDQGRDALGRVRIKFPTAAIAVLAFTGSWPKLGPGQAQLADFAVPADFRAGTDGKG
jgi:phosphohistidine phosphatase